MFSKISQSEQNASKSGLVVKFMAEAALVSTGLLLTNPSHLVKAASASVMYSLVHR